MTTNLGKSCSFCLPRVPFVNCCQFMYLVISLLVLRAGCGIWLYRFLIIAYLFTLYEPRHDKTNKMVVRRAKTPISLGICPVWPQSSLSACRNLGSLATHWAHSEDSDQTGRMLRLIWVFAGRTLILLVLSCRGSYNEPQRIGLRRTDEQSQVRSLLA